MARYILCIALAAMGLGAIWTVHDRKTQTLFAREPCRRGDESDAVGAGQIELEALEPRFPPFHVEGDRARRSVLKARQEHGRSKALRRAHAEVDPGAREHAEVATFLLDGDRLRAQVRGRVMDDGESLDVGSGSGLDADAPRFAVARARVDRERPPDRPELDRESWSRRP